MCGLVVFKALNVVWGQKKGENDETDGLQQLTQLDYIETREFVTDTCGALPMSLINKNGCCKGA